jgi:hypothetical protein
VAQVIWLLSLGELAETCGVDFCHPMLHDQSAESESIGARRINY